MIQSTPKWWRWYVWLNPVAYTLYGLVASQFGDIEDKSLTTTNQTVREFIEDYFGFYHDKVWAVGVAVVGFSFLFAFTFAFSIKALNFQKR